MNYEVGDVIEYQTFGGRPRRVLVTHKADVNGWPGFDGICIEGADPGMTCWGYNDQITRVVRRTVTTNEATTITVLEDDG